MSGFELLACRPFGAKRGPSPPGPIRPGRGSHRCCQGCLGAGVHGIVSNGVRGFHRGGRRVNHHPSPSPPLQLLAWALCRSPAPTWGRTRAVPSLAHVAGGANHEFVIAAQLLFRPLEQGKGSAQIEPHSGEAMTGHESQRRRRPWNPAQQEPSARCRSVRICAFSCAGAGCPGLTGAWVCCRRRSAVLPSAPGPMRRPSQ